MLDDQGREWAGNFHRQRIIERRILRVLRGEHPVDVMGAIGTIVANMVADIADSERNALEGLEATVADMRQTIRERFAVKGSAH